MGKCCNDAVSSCRNGENPNPSNRRKYSLGESDAKCVIWDSWPLLIVGMAMSVIDGKIPG